MTQKVTAQDFNEGDLVEAVKGETVVRDRLVLSKYKCNTGEFGLHFRTVASIPFVNTDETGRDGWTFTLIEKAAPKLPTEPGWYESEAFPLGAAAEYEPYSLRSEGEWYTAGGMRLTPKSVEMQGKLRRLEPVAVTAKRVAEDFVAAILTKNDGQTGNTYKLHVSTLMEIASEWGVEA